MINTKILEKLKVITNEEEKILSGSHEIERKIYMENDTDVIESAKILEKGKLIDIRPHTRFVHFPKHSHNYVEVVYMCQGNTIHIVNDKKIVLKEGELLLLGQGATQEIFPASQEDIAVNFIIMPSFFDQVLEMMEEDSPLKTFITDCLVGKKENTTYLYFQAADILPVQNLVENLLWTLIYDERNARKNNQLTMGLLFRHLLDNTDRLVSENENEAAVVKVLGYIENNYHDASLKELAAEMHYDMYFLSRQIKKSTGKTYKELLQDKRLNRAAYLLKHTGMSIDDIAESLGYSNKSYFHRLFFKRYEMTPKKYRDAI